MKRYQNSVFPGLGRTGLKDPLSSDETDLFKVDAHLHQAQLTLQADTASDQPTAEICHVLAVTQVWPRGPPNLR